MLTLITYPEMFGQFAASPFCTKAACLLQMSGENWQREDTLDPRSFKYSKLPALRMAGGEVICDSENIRQHLEARGADFDKGLSADERASARAFVRMADEHMYFHQVLDRWGNDAVWEVVRKAYFGTIPGLVRGAITHKMRRVLMKGMYVQGLGRFSDAERLARLELDLKAITARLETRPFLFGDAPCSADASVAAVLGGMQASPVKTPQSERVRSDRQLMRYLEQMNSAIKLL